jgi:hypothetical protein
VGEADAAEQPYGAVQRILLGDPGAQLGEHHVLHGGQVREQVEPLEHHADRLPQLREVPARHPVAGEDRLPGHLHRGVVRPFEQVHAAQ